MNDTIKDTLFLTIKDTHREKLVYLIVYLILRNSVSYIQSKLVQKYWLYEDCKNTQKLLTVISFSFSVLPT